MALHQLTPDELSQFENKMASLDSDLQKLRLLVLNLKNKSGNDTTLQTLADDIRTAIEAVGTIIGVSLAAA